jgi:SAM-dependent methyltransferase
MSRVSELPFWERPENVEKFANRQLDVRLGELMDGYAEPSATCVLDIGCAAGRNTVYLAERGFDVHAIDDSAAMTERTRGRVAAILGADEAERRVRRGRMDDLSHHEDATVDLVVVLGVLHSARSLAEWNRAAAEMARVLKPGGLLQTASFAPGTDAHDEGVRPIDGEPHLFVGPSGNPSIQLTVEETDTGMAAHGLVPVEPTVQVERDRSPGTWFVVNGLFSLRA